jgi:hypothetical protein
MQNYRLLNSEDDKRFGEVSIYKNKQNGELVWIKEVHIDDEKTKTAFQHYLNSNAYNRPCYIASNPAIVEPSSGNNICGNCSGGTKIVTVMEFFERDLEGEIMRRNQDMVRGNVI